MARLLQLDVQPLVATPAAPTVTPTGTAGTTSYSYKIVAKQGPGTKTGSMGGTTVNTTAASTAGSTATGNAALSGTNFNHITWTAPAGSAVGAFAGYDVYRTAGGATQGKIGSTAAGVLAFDDTGLVADGTTAPAANTTGVSLGATEFANAYDITCEIGGTFVGTVQLQGSLTGSVWTNLGTSQTAPAIVNDQLKTYVYVRAQMTAYTSGLPVVWVAGHDER